LNRYTDNCQNKDIQKFAPYCEKVTWRAQKVKVQA